MFATHLKLLISKSIRYAWRQRICRCCPKALFEFLLPSVCLLILCLIRWIHTPSSTSSRTNAAHLVEPVETKILFNYTSTYQCPSPNRTILLLNQTILRRLQHLCPRSNLQFINSSFNTQGQLILNESRMEYRCRYDDRLWCEQIDFNYGPLVLLQHPSVSLCQSSSSALSFVAEWKPLIRNSLALDSLIHRPWRKIRLTFSTWPCSSYFSDVLFDFSTRFPLILIAILLDGCILFSFHLLLHVLIEEKRMGTVELLRLLSVYPLSNSFAWFLRQFIVQLFVMVSLTIVFKVPINGSAYFPHLPFGYLFFSLLLWLIQVLSRAILLGHFFNSLLKASIWSWFIYLFSFWLAFFSPIHLPWILRLIVSAWFPFYSIKRLLILLIQINTNLGRSSGWTKELFGTHVSMIVGSLLMWLIAVYIEPIRPGNYGLARSWLWPWDLLRQRKKLPEESIMKSSSNDRVTVRVMNLSKSFARDQHLAVDHISFDLEHSTICGLIGPNGSGKTTTIEMLCGILPSDSGMIEMHGKNLYEHRMDLQRTIGYCPQDDMLFAYLTVEEQLHFYARIRTKDPTIDHRRQIDELLVLMDMKKYDQRLCHTLSGGMKRKVSILCAFVGQVDIILLDEPSASLDPVARQFLRSWLREQKINRTILISSHLLDEIEELCDALIILDAGRICAQGSMVDLKQQYIRSNDRLHLERFPPYLPREWMIDPDNHLIEVPNRKELVPFLERLERDQIRYTLKNTSLEDVFLQLTSTSDANGQDPKIIDAQMKTIFQTKSRPRPWFEQALGVLYRRLQVFLKQARLLPLIVLIYFILILLIRYLPSWTPPSKVTYHYIISTPSEFQDRFTSTDFEKTFLPPVNASSAFEKYLMDIPTRRSDNDRRRTYIGLRVISSEHLQCYFPSPYVSHLIQSCLRIFSSFSNRSISPVEIITRKEQLALDSSSVSLSEDPNSYLCFYTLPPTLHSAVLLLSLILIISSALTIQDYTSGLYSYSLIHGLQPWIHWLIVYLTDLILSLLWFIIVIVIARVLYPSTFHGLFYAFGPLFYVIDLPFIYLMSRVVQSPVLGATGIFLLLQFVHFLNTFKLALVMFRSSPFLSLFVPFLRWSLILLFPNVNLDTLIVAVLRRSSCPVEPTEFASEQYSNKILIHTLIFIGQWIIYCTLLVFIDRFRWNFLRCCQRSSLRQNKDEDLDVFAERQRIRSMDDHNKEREALVVENLSKSFHRSSAPVVDRLTFAVAPGECFGLLGFNGSGKTTTFRMLVGDLEPSQGSIYRHQTSTIGYCPQHDIAFPAMTVVQTIEYICRLHGLEPSRLVEALLTQFQLNPYRHRQIAHLSGGTCRRLHLALALIGAPTLLLLDEPTAKVDPLLRAQLRLLLQHRSKDVAIVFASHSMFECEQLCDRLTILVQGQAQCLGSPEHIKERFGRKHRVRLEVLEQTSLDIPALMRVNDSIEYIYVNEKLSQLFALLEGIVAERRIAPNYTVQVTSLEHVFLSLQFRLGRDN